MTNDRDDETSPYDPTLFRSPDNAPRRHFEHRRKYDQGLIAAPVASAWTGKVVVAIVLTAAVAFFGAFYTIGNATNAACEQRQEVATALVGIIRRGEPRLVQLTKSGVLTKAQLKRSLEDNDRAVKDLTFPAC